MARSIHDTWGVLRRARQADWSDADVPRAIVAEMKGNLRRQRAIRESERQLRKRGGKPVPAVHPDQVPILVDDEGPYVFHPASEEDVRAVLRRLPPGSIDGLQAIRLCIDRRAQDPEWPREPFTGRRRFEVIPGVYTADTLGSYTRSRATIRLYAYLCDPAAVAPFAIFFKLHALKVLLHELGHHFDLTFRVGRSRWDVRDREKDEAWAERSESEGARDNLVGPYIAERYPSECAALEQWMEEHGGATFPALDFLLDERRWPLHHAFFTLVHAVHAGHDRDATRVAFARELRESGAWRPAEQIVRTVLAGRPDHPEALAISAFLAMRKDRRDFETAESLCKRAIGSDPKCLYAWRTLVRCYAAQERWEESAQACEEGLSIAPADDLKTAELLLALLAHSHLLLGDFGKVEGDLERMHALGTNVSAVNAEIYGCIAGCWAEKWEEAFLLASRLQKTEKDEGAFAVWITAVRFECAHRLGRPHLAGAFSEADLTELEQDSFTRKWARRIREHIDMNIG